MRWYAVLFWIWVVASLGVFLWRRVNASDADEQAEDQPPSALTKQWAPPPPDPDAPPERADEDVAAPADSSPARPTVPGTIAAAGPASSGAPPSLADLLQGIALPCDLVPLTQSVTTTGPMTELVAGTTSARADEVGTALADEIERLGYTVSTINDRLALAEGPRGAVEIEIHPDAGSATDGGALKFPTAESGTVVVELRVAKGRR